MTHHNSRIDCSFVIPVYYNEGCLFDTMSSLMEVIRQNTRFSFEVIFIDDGSQDNSFHELLEIQKANPKIVKLIKLTRNFGQPAARLAGLKYAKGRCVISMSADGQDPVSLCHDMLKEHFENNYEIVICTRSARDESFYRRLTSQLFYWMMRKLSFSNMPTGGFDYILIGRKVLNVLLQNQDAQPFIQGQILWSGYTPKFIHYHRLARKTGRSRWTFGKKIALLIDGVINYSFLPIRLMSLIGIFVSFLGFIMAFIILIRRAIIGSQVPGWTTLTILILIVSGIQMIMIGIVGEYLWRTLAQSRDRDHFVIEKVIDNESGS